MLSRKMKDTEKISSMKTNEIMKARKETAKVLKSFFWNLIAKIWIFNSINKHYRDSGKVNFKSYFFNIENKDISMEINNLSTGGENCDVVSDFILSNLNDCISSS